MGNKYQRTTNRGSWTQDSLGYAMNLVLHQKVAIRQAARMYGIPERTLRRRLSTKNDQKVSLGRQPQLTDPVEAKLSIHIVKLQSYGFAPTKKIVCSLAFKLAVSLGIKHSFNTEKKTAGPGWFKFFMGRHPELAERMSQGISIARAEGLSRDEVANHFALLKKTLVDLDLVNKGSHIFNMDESGIQLNNNPGKVIAKKGSKDVHVLKSSERGETVTAVACCSAEGHYLPPYCIMKGKICKPEYADGLPAGSVLKMNPKSGYISTELFMDWLRNHFTPRKPPGKVLLILDGHASHMKGIEMLDFIEENDIVLFCLPSHTSHYLQPLDRTFFKPLKSYYTDAANNYVFNNPGRRITRFQFGSLLNRAWVSSATVTIATNGFSETGIVPFDPTAIPDHAFLLCNPNNTSSDTNNTSSDTTHSTSVSSNSSTLTLLNSTTTTTTERPSTPEPSEPELVTSTPKNSLPQSPKFSPITKTLHTAAPCPTIPLKEGRRKQHAVLIDRQLKNKVDEKKAVKAPKKRMTRKQKECKENAEEKEIPSVKTKENAKTKAKSVKRKCGAANPTKNNPKKKTAEKEPDDYACFICGSNVSTSKETWIQCNMCEQWGHQACTSYAGVGFYVCDFCQADAKEDLKLR